MQYITLDTFNERLATLRAQPRIKRELRFVASTSHLITEDWAELEMLPITTKARTKGILLISTLDHMYAPTFELKQGLASAATGKAQAIICDICRTWQSGSRAGSITFTSSATSSVTFLCCADLRCSDHVRSKTSASKTSRAQLRENMTTEDRIQRLQSRLQTIVQTIQAPVF